MKQFARRRTGVSGHTLIKNVNKSDVGFFHHNEIQYHTRTSLFLFSDSMRIRKAAVWLIHWKAFKVFILLVVISNSIMMSFYSYGFRMDPSQPSMTPFEDISEKVITSIFTLEFLVKVIAMGLILEKNTYMRDPWNVLDFVCLLTGIAEQTPLNIDTFIFLRTLRVLKPLRSVKVLHTLKDLINGLFQSLKGLVQVYCFLAFVLAFFAIFGVNMFAGYQYRACRLGQELVTEIDPETGLEVQSWPIAPGIDRLCNSDEVCQAEVPGTYCGSVWKAFELDPREIDHALHNDLILNNVPNFDTFSNALLTTFQVCTLESWSQLMYNYADSSDYPITSYLFFITLVTVGAFFSLNLILAQIMESYVAEQQKLKRKKFTDDYIKYYTSAAFDHTVRSVRKAQNFIYQKQSDSSPQSSSNSQSLSSQSAPSQIRIESQPQQESNRDQRERNDCDAHQPSGNLDTAGICQEEENAQFQDEGNAIYVSQSREKDRQRYRNMGRRKSMTQDDLKSRTMLELEISCDDQENDNQADNIQDGFKFDLKGQQHDFVNQNQSHVFGREESFSEINDQSKEEIQLIQKDDFDPEQEDQIDFDFSGAEKCIKEQAWVINDQSESSEPNIDVTSSVLRQLNGDGDSNQDCSKQSLSDHGQPDFHPTSALDRGKLFQIIEQRELSNGSSDIAEADIENQPSQANIPLNRASTIKKQESEAQSSQEQSHELLFQELDQTVYQHQDQGEEFKMQNAQMQDTAKLDHSHDSENQDSNTKVVSGQEQFDKGSRLHKFCLAIVCSPLFNIAITVIILLNTISLSLYRYDEPEEQANFGNYADMVFVAVFTIEFVLKIIGFGVKNFAIDPFNKFDAFIVSVSLVELALSYIFENAKFELLLTLKAMRAIRLLKIVRYNEGMRTVLRQTWKSLLSITGFGSLLLLFMFLWALMGMELFAYRAVLDQNNNLIKASDTRLLLESGKITSYDFPRINFNDMFSSLVNVYILIIGEDWNIMMNDLVLVMDKTLERGWWIPKAYCVIGIICGNFTLLALFTGILLQAFSEESEKQKNETKDQDQLDFEAFWRENKSGSNQQEKCSKQRIFKMLNNIYSTFGVSQEKQVITDQSSQQDVSSKSEEVQDAQVNDQILIEQNDQPEEEQKLKLARQGIDPAFNEESPGIRRKNTRLNLQINHYEEKKFLKDSKVGSSIDVGQILQLHDPLGKGSSLCIFNKNNKFRKLCFSVCQSRYFEICIFIIIVVNSGMLAFESPLLDQHSQTMHMVNIAGVVCTIIFTLEALLEIIAFGFYFNGSKSYLRNGWNVLDFFIVVSSIFDLFFEGSSWLGFRVIRILRILRPIRIISHNDGLQLAMKALIKSMPQIVKLQLVTSFLLFMISILQTRLFSGKFYSCYTEHLGLSVTQIKQLIVTKQDCLSYGGEWIKPDFNFDTIGASFRSLTSIASSEGWVGVLWNTIDAKDVDMQPQKDYRKYFGSLYTVTILFVISLLFLNLFIGVVIETFNRQKQLSSYNQVLRPAQRDYLKVKLMAFDQKLRKVPDQLTMSHLRRFCTKVTEHKTFDIFILVCIFLNTIGLACYYFMMPHYQIMLLNRINFAFIFIFAIESIMKIIACRLNYFRDFDNQFDFTIIFLSCVFMILINIGYGQQFHGLISILRMLRVMRIIKLVVRAEQIMIIYRTLAETLPVLGSFSILLVIFLFILSTISVQFFALIDLAPIEGLDRQMGYHVNFRDFGSAFLTLFRCATGEAWNSIMFELTWKESILFQCNQDESYESIIAAGRDPNNWKGPKGCGNWYVSFIFFSTFQILVAQIYLNLIIAIIVDAFSAVTHSSQLPVDDKLIDSFVKIWQQLDPDATYYIPVSKLDELFKKLVESEDCTQIFIVSGQMADNVRFRERQISSLEIPTFDGLKKVMFYDVLLRLCGRAFKIRQNRVMIRENFEKLRVMRTLASKNIAKIDIEALHLGAQNQDFEFDLNDPLLRDLDQKKKRVELIRKYTRQITQLKKKYCHLVDRFGHVHWEGDQENQGELITTRHYIAGCTIMRLWKEYKLQQQEDRERGLRSQGTQVVPES